MIFPFLSNKKSYPPKGEDKSEKVEEILEEKIKKLGGDHKIDRYCDVDGNLLFMVVSHENKALLRIDVVDETERKYHISPVRKEDENIKKEIDKVLQSLNIKY